MANEQAKVVEQYLELVRYMAGSLLDDEIEIDVKAASKNDPLRIELFVPDAHRGRVIGRGGRIARSMRTLLNIAGVAYHHSVVLDIVD